MRGLFFPIFPSDFLWPPTFWPTAAGPSPRQSRSLRSTRLRARGWRAGGLPTQQAGGAEPHAHHHTALGWEAVLWRPSFRRDTLAGVRRQGSPIQRRLFEAIAPRRGRPRPLSWAISITE